MADNFKYDVFLSHSPKDKAVVRAIAARLRADGLRVWFDESGDGCITRNPSKPMNCGATLLTSSRSRSNAASA